MIWTIVSAFKRVLALLSIKGTHSFPWIRAIADVLSQQCKDPGLRIIWTT
jgi:hypothetical protein